VRFVGAIVGVNECNSVFSSISGRSCFALELKRPSAAGIDRWDKQQKLAFDAAFRAV